MATPAIPQACAGVAHPTEPARCAYRAANRGCELQGCTIVEGKCALYLRPLATRQALEYSNFAIPALSNVFDTRDRGIAHGSRVCCSILACTMAHHTSCRSSAQCTRKRNSWIPFCRTVRNHAHLSILACCCSAVLSNPEPVRRFLVACWMWPNLTYRSTANTSQHLLTVAQTHLFWVYMDRACECGQGALKYSCSFISEAAKSYHAALKIIDA